MKCFSKTARRSQMYRGNIPNDLPLSRVPRDFYIENIANNNSKIVLLEILVKKSVKNIIYGSTMVSGLWPSCIFLRNKQFLQNFRRTFDRPFHTNSKMSLQNDKILHKKLLNHDFWSTSIYQLYIFVICVMFCVFYEKTQNLILFASMI